VIGTARSCFVINNATEANTNQTASNEKQELIDELNELKEQML
jgi:hypothetical protein